MKEELYKCGHKGEPVFLDDNILSLTAYLQWVENDGWQGNKSKCWKCWNKSENDSTPTGIGKSVPFHTDFDIERIREEFSHLAHDIHWQTQRSLMPYDWNSYGGDHFHKLCDLLKIGSDGSIKSKDKRGSWRVMNKSKREDANRD